MTMRLPRPVSGLGPWLATAAAVFAGLGIGCQTTPHPASAAAPASAPAATPATSARPASRGLDPLDMDPGAAPPTTGRNSHG
jgi:hypothetical protein